jgi:putative pyruvate formate lyase activating enzyme
MLYLQDELGCHNINFVSPTHFVPQLVRAVLQAIPMGLHLPLVYNTNGYDCIATLKELEGIISIYLPDLKYASDEHARRFSGARQYVTHCRQAIKEMYRQVGDLVVDESEIAQQGLIVRHLVLPNGLAGSAESLTWLARELSPAITVSVMSQYLPAHRVSGTPLLSRTISTAEYEEVVRLLCDLRMDNGWVQDMAAPDNYVPDFQRQGHPFEPGSDRYR